MARRTHKAATRSSRQRRTARRARRRDWFWPAVLSVCAIGALVRGGILIEHLYGNPFAYAPITDGAVYWDWAGRLAAGQWSSRTPFVSAPLYPYLLGLIRALGGGLAAVYVVQLVFDVLTAGALAWIGRARFGSAVGLAAAIAWFIIDEPAFYITRVLNSSLQVFLVVALWMLLIRWQCRWRWSDGVLVGAALGLNCLANPAMLALLPIVPIWTIVWARRCHRDAPPEVRTSDLGASGQAVAPPATGAVIGQAAAGAAIALGVIAPATWHNWRACGEFIPITACPGITLRQGNGPGAVGTYVAIPGVSRGRERLFSDAAQVYQRATGRPARWRDVDAYFRDQALAYWRDDPIRAVKLIVRRAYWFVTGRYYCDVHQPTWERDEGFARMLWAAPIPTAWLIPTGLVGMIALIRRIGRWGPEWMLLAVPLLVVAVIQYSPRYRLPAVPVVVVVAASVWVRAVRWRSARMWAAAALAAGVVGIATGPVNRATGFEDPAGLAYNNEYNLAVALGKLGRREEAEDRLERALAIAPKSPDAHNDLGVLLAGRGEFDEAVRHYRLAMESRPDWAQVESNLGVALVRLGRFEEAIEHYRRAERNSPDSPEVRLNLGNALADSDRPAEAAGAFRQALTLRPDYADAHDHLAIVLVRLGRRDEAIEHWERALQIDPNRQVARSRFVRALCDAGRYERAIVALRDGLRRCPDDWAAANDLVWLLATCPRADLRSGKEAVALGERVLRAEGAPRSAVLDSLAAAYAETGQFDRAAETGRQALELARREGGASRAASIEARLELYRGGRPFRQGR